MFYYLDGTVAELLPYLAVIDCGGVGYACKTMDDAPSFAALSVYRRRLAQCDCAGGSVRYHGYNLVSICKII